jgi:inhibitor of KinA sporulation pathway (predicted exonuclease)
MAAATTMDLLDAQIKDKTHEIEKLTREVENLKSQKISSMSSKGDGAIYALVAKGAQDQWMNSDPQLFSNSKQNLTQRYQVVYRKIRTQILKYCNNTLSLQIYLKKGYYISLYWTCIFNFTT